MKGVDNMVVATKLRTSITLTFNQGLDGDGKVILKNEKYAKVKLIASEDSIFQVAESLSSLNSFPLLAITKQDDSNIVQE